MTQTPFFYLATAFVITFVLIYALNPIAQRLKLVDKPDNQRKKHKGNISLTGGICVYLSLAFCLLIFGKVNQLTTYFLLSCGLVVLSGVLDDRFNLSVRLRIAIEATAASIMIFGAHLWIGNLGNLVGLGEVHMPFWLAYPFTLIAVFGIINAINMIDGLDGLASGIGLITLAVLLFLTDNSPTLSAAGFFFVGGLLAFLLFNFQASPLLPKVFLGDAGSKLIGLTLVWVIIESAHSQGSATQGINPVTALFIVGLPLIDMVTTTVRRLKKGVSPFSPDRTHMHHILQRAGFQKRTSLLMLLVLGLVINLFGIFLLQLNIHEAIQLAIFFALYFFYAYNVHHAWRLSRWLKKHSNNRKESVRVETKDELLTHQT